MSFLFVFLGGGLGSVLRYIVGEFIPKTTFPWATFTVNTVGGLLIGLFYVWSERFGWDENIRVALLAGFCGGFTTFSTFSKETFSLLTSGRVMVGLIYILCSIICTLGAVAIGYWVGNR